MKLWSHSKVNIKNQSRKLPKYFNNNLQSADITDKDDLIEAKTQQDDDLFN